MEPMMHAESGATPLDQLELPPRARASLARAGLRTVDDIRGLSALELLVVPNFGRKSLLALKAALTARGFDLPVEPALRPPVAAEPRPPP